MGKIKGTYLGGLRSELLHEKSGTKIIADAPSESNGKGESFSPTDMVSAALGACVLTYMGAVASEKGFSIDGTTYEITKSMRSNPRRIAEINLIINLPPDIKYTEKQKKMLERVAKICPVGASLHESISEYIEFNYGDE